MINYNRTINIIYKEGTSKAGKRYKIPYTYDFGFALTVSVNGNLQVYKDDQGYYINYDARNAEIKTNQYNQLVLHITDKL